MRGVFVENNDSFSWNVLEALPVAREQVEVVPVTGALAALEGADFLVVGPGPTDPARAGLLEVVRAALTRGLPTLGICLGHQALGLALGARLVRSTPCHGHTATAHFRGGARWLPGVQGAVEVMRYHSLSLVDVPSPLEVVAALDDGTVMAIEHREQPVLGLQFHPDSYATPRGAELLERFFAAAFAARGFPLSGHWAHRPSPAATPSPSPVASTHAAPLALSFLTTRDDFALLGPGYTGGPHWTLLDELTAGGDELHLASGDGAEVHGFGGARRPVALELDVGPAALAPTLDEAGFLAGVEAIREAIAAGDVYQVNLTQRVDLGEVSGAQLLATLCQRGVPPYAAWLKLKGFGEVVSASPELLFELDGATLRAQPMKGTARPDRRAALEASQKDRAELAMITDLLRDDLHRLCRPGSVRVVDPRRFIELPYALQTVSDVEGKVREGVTLAQVFAQLHPAASVTGAPRAAALAQVARLEATPRSYYCGALGLRTGARTRAAVLIRTAVRGEGQPGFRYGVGGGITFQSDAAEELAELQVKLGALR